MALGDITILEQASFNGGRGARVYNVASGAVASIKAGELVQRTLGGATVYHGITNAQVVATDFIVGIAATTSTDTAAAAGTVNVIPLSNQQTWLIAPTTAASWDAQSEYDALVGDRVLIADGSGSIYTIGATDTSTSGCVVQPLDVAKYPGKVAFAFRSALSDLA